MSYTDVVKLSHDSEFRQRLLVAAVAHQVPAPDNWVTRHALWVSLYPPIRAAWEYAILDRYRYHNGENPTVITDDMIDERVQQWCDLPYGLRPNPPIDVTTVEIPDTPETPSPEDGPAMFAPAFIMPTEVEV